MRHTRFLASGAVSPAAAVACAVVLALLAPGCGEKTPDTPEVAPVGAETEDAAPSDAEALAAETREKLLALAVASECLRKNGTPPEEAAKQMLALYKENAIELTTYTREMTKLAVDLQFQASIDAKAKECPAAITADAIAETGPDASAATTADTAADVTAESAAPDAASDTLIAAIDTAAATAETTADTAIATAETTAPEIADTQPAAPETQVIVDTVMPETIADTRVEPPADTRVTDTRITPEVIIVPEEVSYTGTWTGQLYGGASPGTLRVAITGRTITSAVATFGRTSVRLKGTISEKGALSLGGTSGQDFMRASGKVQTGGRGINGTWDGVVDKKKSNGRFLLKR